MVGETVAQDGNHLQSFHLHLRDRLPELVSFGTGAEQARHFLVVKFRFQSGEEHLV